MDKKIDEKTLVEIIKKDEEFQKESLKISKERTRGRLDLIESYWITPANFYIRKKKYIKAISRNLEKR